MDEADVVVIGAGHNGLVAACHLARAGLRVCVLERRGQVGGGVVTEALTVPGFKHDTWSSGHPWLLTNPLLKHDELRLIEGGLRYVGHDPLLVLPLDDGRSLTIWRSAEKTAREIAHFSQADAKRWRELGHWWGQVAHRHLMRVEHPAGQLPAPSAADEALEREYLQIAARSAVDVVMSNFESEAVRAAALWFAAVTVQPIDQPGSGLLPIAVPAGWAAYGWMNVVGGASMLADALAGELRAHGGEVQLNAAVQTIQPTTRGGHVVRHDQGLVHATRAVLAATHFSQLVGMVGSDRLPPAFKQRVATWKSGPSLFVVHLALPQNQQVRTASGSVSAVLTGHASVAGVVQQCVNVANHQLTRNDPYFLAACSSCIDPSRAPLGRGVLKLITSAPYHLDGDAANWDAAKSDYADWLVEQYAGVVVNFKPGQELGRFVQSPLDIERANPSYHRGAPQGGEMLPDQMGSNRPVVGYADYRSPIVGLYMTGVSTHPGGPVSGWPGRHAAQAILHDLGIPGATHARPGFTFSCPVIDTTVSSVAIDN